MNRLLLCARTEKRPGWVTLDAQAAFAPDIVATLPPLPPEVVAQAWQEIELVHGITSFYPWDGEQLLRELYLVLAPGGKLVLEQVDFNQVAGRVEWVFGDPTLRDPWHLNKWAYTPQSLSALLGQLGYSRVEVLPAQQHRPERDFRIEAYK